MATTQSSPNHGKEHNREGRKRRRTAPASEAETSNQKRRTACQPCRARKVKCDNARPACALCRTSGIECEYLQAEEKLTLESATRLIIHRVDQIQRSVDEVNASLDSGDPILSGVKDSRPTESRPKSLQAADAIERSRDYLQIPPHKTSSDTVLTWPVFEDRYPSNHLIQALFTPSISLAIPETSSNAEESAKEIFTVPGGLRCPADERIPALIDNFLQNVHTKNPVLDVESLVRRGRVYAEQGLGWDAWSCLVLVVCALGSIAKPFDIASPDVEGFRHSAPSESLLVASATSSAQLFARDLQAAESCFVLACRRLGSLKHTLLGAQCHFFAGVYLMYTLRPILSWTHFHQASIFYQLHLKSSQGVVYGNDSEVLQVPLHHLQGAGRKERRLEQSLYWSCFKSESEFRIELPLPQSELSQYDYPNLFPSPPSPPSPAFVEDIRTPTSLQHFNHSRFNDGLSGLTRLDTNSTIAEEEDAELRQHAKKLCNEEESWYYYLTEIALRRIGNRIINTFFRQDHRTWLDIKPLISIALEFDAQVSSWSAHLPPAMQHYESASSIRAPNLNPHLHERNSFVSRELSWATDNRILEMRSWLYQPFLYYLIHSSSLESVASVSSTSGVSPNISHHRQPSNTCTLLPEDTRALHNMITAGIECNLKIMDVRSLRHRHHGLWYDLRSTMCASILLLAIVKTGQADLIPGGTDALFGSRSSARVRHDADPAMVAGGVPPSSQLGGRLRKVLDSFEFWGQECPDLYRHRDVLESLALDVKRECRIP